MSKAWIFDLDGTLLDTLPDIAGSSNATLEHFGYPRLSQRVIRSYIGDGSRELIARAMRHDGRVVSDQDIDNALKFYLDYYRQHLIVDSVLYPNVKKVLKKAQEAGIILAVLTNKPETHARHLLSHFALDSYFQMVIGGDTLDVRKPDPKSLRHICDGLELDPQECLMIGDSANDIRTGKAVGAKTVLLDHGYGDSKTLMNHPSTRADNFFSDMQNLLTLLD